MSKQRVPLWGKPQGYVTIDPAATEGATFGVNLRWPNGALVRREDLAGAVGGGNDRSVVLWELVQKVPVNVKGLAAATGEGVYRIGPGGAGFTDTTTTHLPEGTNLYFTDGRAEDAAASLLTTGLHTGISFTYDDAAGRLNATVTGGGGGGATPSATHTATEALAAGDFVNITAAGVRKAKAAPGYEAHGFVMSAFSSGATATIYLAGGMNMGMSGLTVGKTYFLSSTAGAVTDDVTGYGAGTLIHRIGVAISATAIDFNPQFPIELA